MSGFGVRAGVIACTLLIALAVGVLAASAQAATYTVGTAADPGGACADPADGTCSLRQLVEYENALAVTPSPADTIVLPGGEYQLKTGELVITQSLVIAGAGARTTHVVADGDLPERVFDIKVPGKGAPPTVSISGLEISGGTAGRSNGSFGGDVYSAGNLVLEEDWITAGTASSGGGVSNDTGTLRIERSLVSGNHASSGGGDSGGVQNHGSAVCGAACSPGKKAVLTVEDSTIAGNDARLGGGIFSWSDGGVADGNQVSIIDSTIAENTVENEVGGPAREPAAGGLLIGDGTADVSGSIVAFNSATINEVFKNSNCASGPGTIVSLGYNLANTTDCGFKSTGDLQETFPNFSSSEPQNNGGATNTLALEPTSAGVDAIPTSNHLCVGADQRGITRPQGAGCDIGAVEIVPLTIKATEGSLFSGNITTARCSIFGTPTIAWGDGQKSNATVKEGAIGGSHTYAEEGTYNGSVSYEDDCGAHKFPFQAKVADAALSATGETLSAAAGAQFNGRVTGFSDADPGGVASDYTASINWGDGTSSTAGTVSVAGKGFAVSGSHTYAGGGVYQTSVTITDAGGAKAVATGSANVTFTIQATEGAEFSGKLVTSGCGVSGTPTIEWGDGQKSSGTVKESVISGGHIYAEEGTFNGAVRYEDKCGKQNVAFQAKVADAALSATGASVSAAAVVQFAGEVAAFSDADPAGVASDYTASINWGDGSPSTSGTISSVAGKGFAVTGSHTYSSGGVYPTSVTIKDAGGAKATATGSAKVASTGPPVVSNVSVQSVTETTATITFTIDPDGADTSYVIDYGPGTSYGQSTAPVDIGATGGPQQLTRMLTELEPGHTYHFDVVATNSQAAEGERSEDQPFKTQQSGGGPPAEPSSPPSGNPPGGGVQGGGTPGGGAPGEGVLGFVGSSPATLATLPPPVLGKTVNVDVVSGKVFVSLPATGYVAPLSLVGPPLAAAFASLSKGFKFIPLTEARQIPVGSTLETTGGVVAIATATATVGKTQSGEFGAGIFTLLQSRKQRGLSELDIVDNHSPKQACVTVGKKARTASKHLSSKVLGRLTGTAHGGFTTRGQYSAATVRGTVWGVRNRCDGTLTKVTRGIVSVRDFRRRKTITLFTGQSYLAKAPGA